MARHNGLPAVRVSELPPGRVLLAGVGRPLVCCPWCDRWCPVSDGLVLAHDAGAGTGGCYGSRQRVRVDLSVAEWAARVLDDPAARLRLERLASGAERCWLDAATAAGSDPGRRSAAWSYRAVVPGPRGRRYAGPSGARPSLL